MNDVLFSITVCLIFLVLFFFLSGGEKYFCGFRSFEGFICGERKTVKRIFELDCGFYKLQIDFVISEVSSSVSERPSNG